MHQRVIGERASGDVRDVEKWFSICKSSNTIDFTASTTDSKVEKKLDPQLKPKALKTSTKREKNPAKNVFCIECKCSTFTNTQTYAQTSENRPAIVEIVGALDIEREKSDTEGVEESERAHIHEK